MNISQIISLILVCMSPSTAFSEEQKIYKPFSAPIISKKDMKANSYGKIILFYGEPLQGAESSANAIYKFLKERNPNTAIPLIEVYRGGEKIVSKLFLKVRKVIPSLRAKLIEEGLPLWQHVWQKKRYCRKREMLINTITNSVASCISYRRYEPL